MKKKAKAERPEVDAEFKAKILAALLEGEKPKSQKARKALEEVAEKLAATRVYDKQEVLLGTKEVAQRLGVCVARVRKLAADGRISSRLVGGARVYPEAEVARFAEVPRINGRPCKSKD